MSCIENVVFEKSLNTEATIEHSKFKSRQWIWIPDNNNNNYASGQLIFDCSSFASTSGYCWWQDAYFLIPVVIASKCPDAAAGGMNNSKYLHALKSGYWNLFNSFTITQNNTTIHQNIPFSNMYISYKMLTDISDEELRKYGKMLGMAKDTASSARKMNSVTVDGIGMTNNENYPSNDKFHSLDVSYSDTGLGINYGLKQRQEWTSAYAQGNQKDAAANTIEVDDANHTIVSYVLATIRLKDISTYFANLPLVKGAKLNFIINVNQGSETISLYDVTGGGAHTNTSGYKYMDLKVNDISMVGGATTFPGMITSTHYKNVVTDLTQSADKTVGISYVKAANGAANITLSAANDTSITMSIGFCKTSINNISYSNKIIQQCRLYMPIYELTTEAEKEYLDAGINKTFAYNELFGYQQYNITANNIFNINITSGIANAKELVVMPLMSSKQLVTHKGDADQSEIGYSSLLSPFTTAPATLDIPTGGITDYNVQFGGANVYAQNVQYTFQNYMMETKNLGLNGAYVRGITSGQISFDDWELLYGYYVTDLSNRSSQEQGMAKSISLLGKNNNDYNIDLYAFIAYEKRVSVNVVTGDITIS